MNDHQSIKATSIFVFFDSLIDNHLIKYLNNSMFYLNFMEKQKFQKISKNFKISFHINFEQFVRTFVKIFIIKFEIFINVILIVSAY